MSKRAICPQCERPTKTCLCDVMTCLNSRYQLVILQDPKEAKHALSSAPLLQKSISSARLEIAEIFDPIKLFGKLWQTECLVVFPNENSISVEQAKKTSYKYLILLDGTWKKVTKMLHLNPWLTKLPSIAIQSSYGSEYIVRKSPREDGLSTIEAAVSILNSLEPEKNFEPILKSFHKMISFQITAMGKEKFERNYNKD